MMMIGNSSKIKEKIKNKYFLIIKKHLMIRYNKGRVILNHLIKILIRFSYFNCKKRFKERISKQ
jgi:calcineurin-like phosphoesterase family protein